MNPIEASKQLETTLQNYVRRTLPVERAVPEMTEALETMFSEHRLVQDSYMEIQPPYKAGESLQQLVDDGIIRLETAKIFAKAFLGSEEKREDFVLYSHQAAAVRAVCGKDKNLVVCSGTGSGKTECFLIPLVDHLVSQWEEQGRPDQLAPGVQAMILYPMNALVNDQIRRLREILEYASYIRFGKYTGELSQIGREGSLEDELRNNFADYSGAIQNACNGTKWSGAGFDNERPIRNEVTRRSVWASSPAHILVTNYSMLERLLLLPETSPLFDNPWKYIVLDEAHCYDGALGTEIAWLVRRLQKRVGTPESLRFLATSATLIDDPDMTPGEKAKHIQEEFASQIFPAKASSFHVGFGSPAETSFESAREWGQAPFPEAYTQLTTTPAPTAFLPIFKNMEGISDNVIELPDNATLLKTTQALFGLESWIKHVKNDLELIPKEQTTAMAVGDAMHLLRAVDAIQENNLLKLDELNKCSLFSKETSKTLCVLRDFVISGNGPLHDRSMWRGHLHDPADPNPSSEKGDTYQKNDQEFQNRVGNRLYLLGQWGALQENMSPEGLTVEGLEWLLKCADELATTCSDLQMSLSANIMDVSAVLSEQAFAIVKRASELTDKLSGLVAQARGQLLEEWKQCLPNAFKGKSLSEGTDANSIEELLVSYLGQNPDFLKLGNHLKACMKNGERADDATFTATAESLWPGVEEKRRESSLVSLVSLASLAVPAGQYKPLLDVRYHQLVRGISSVGVCFEGDPQNGQDLVRLLASDQSTWESDDGQPLAVFSLGVCRNCGQPFLMGYAGVQTIEEGAGTLSLSRIPKPKQEYLHAIAWAKGQPVDDADQKDETTVYFNRFTGEVRSDAAPANHDGWCRGVWCCSPQNQQSPKFLRECPCCRETRNVAEGAMYGLITPYEARGSQFRITLLDSLYQLADPSMNPAARNHPGEGRKLLAFSDSRRGAATLTMEQQEFWADTTMSQLVPEAIKLPMDDALLKKLTPAIPNLQTLLNLLNGPNCNEKMRPGILAEMGQMVRQSRGTLGCEAVLFQGILENLNCARLLEFEDQNGKPLAPDQAAQIRLLLSLRKKSRYGLLQRGIIQLESKAFQHAREHDTPVWQHARTASGLDDEALTSLCSEIYRTLFGQANLQIPDDWQEQEINSLFHRNIQKGAGQNILRFVTPHPRSRLNRIVQEHTNRNAQQAEKVLQGLWSLFSQTNNGVDSPLVDTGNEEYQLRMGDILLRLGDTSDTEPLPHERYDKELITRPLLPLRVEEHTAQIGKEKGAAYQRAYAEGMINILSCSTTFEMGVDLGDLGLVFLSNLPPLVSNYRQRAGRAGRRPGAPAYVVSFVGDAPHDRYYFDHASELLFGRVQSPRIYLDSPVFRARHLRAEALHQFLTWMDESERWVAGGENPSHDNNQVQISRNWKIVGHFFQGLRAGRHSITGRFDPIVNELGQWTQNCCEDVQDHCMDISDVPNLDYIVCEDLVWQLKTQTENSVRPYCFDDTENIRRYQELGGPNQPRMTEDHLGLAEQYTSRELQYRVGQMYDSLRQGGALTPSQRHLLQESTIDWLSKNRVLPKYGFPCDVIRMVPHENDVYGADVKLDRDLKIGLYEYSPKQTVIADKRAYTCKVPLVYTQGGLPTALQDATHPFHQCISCHAVFEGEPPESFTCNLCGGNRPTSLPAIIPDAFQSEYSRPARDNLNRQAGAARQQLYTGGFRRNSEKPVEKLSLCTAESDTGEILHINMGPRYQGFKHENTNYALYHRVKTDIAVWLLPDIPRLDGGRKRNALHSALEALLRSISLECGVNEREVGGLLYEDRNAFVLYDESSGGGGTVLPLVLTGNTETDAPRNKLIKRIIERAIGLCQDCPECGFNNHSDIALEPIDADEYRINGSNGENRPRESCYHCLRHYGNQRRHHLLDRWDATIVLKAIKAIAL